MTALEVTPAGRESGPRQWFAMAPVRFRVRETSGYKWGTSHGLCGQHACTSKDDMQCAYSRAKRNNSVRARLPRGSNIAPFEQ